MDEVFAQVPKLGAMHVVLDLLDCEKEKLIGWKKWYADIKRIIVSSGMTIATHHSTGAQCELGHDYPGDGSGYTYTAYVLESHVIVHTTPESNLVNVCVFFCNFREDNVAKAIAVAVGLADLFGSKNIVETRVRRYS